MPEFASVTTIYQPDPTCFAPSNLWVGEGYGCDTAYEFTTAGPEPTTILTVIDGTTYPMTHATQLVYCKAASIKQLSGSKVTMSVIGYPRGSTTPTTTVVDWDYDNDFIAVTPAKIQKYLYTGKPGTTSTCFGDSHCVMNHNPIQPRPTHAPYGTYVPPPSSAVTQFTPAPSCLTDSNLWLVSDRCSLTTDPHSPPWLQCTHTVAGDPDPTRADCYPVGLSTVITGTPTYYTDCPAGYTTANSTEYFPWTVGNGGPAYDGAKATWVTCCPSAFGGGRLSFTHTSPPWSHTTVRDGTTHTVSSRTLPPYCAAFGGGRGDETLTLGLYSNGVDGRPGNTYDGASEATWDTAGGTLYAHAQTLAWTVFHGTHTCFDPAECREYFTYSYGNTMGPGVVVATPTPTPTRDSEGGGGGGGEAASSSSTAGAAALVPMRGDGRAGLAGVVVVVVTVVVNVVLGAGLT
ncbi:hypothetical protein F5144DRAFT_491001 [Chaetomium tenue]|uniref:Uncharacterized protein n=1 Tax=Chaetomium tenue TaxID=1854479 RepID=A0ACB7P8H6_9PEZI|nr:hypothetical protein F5144DRAFT_491001 [Chaetomium globosum]